MEGMMDKETDQYAAYVAEMSARHGIARLKLELGQYRDRFGCLTCGEIHPPESMCPPYEVRTTGQAWFQTPQAMARRIAELLAENVELRERLVICQDDSRLHLCAEREKTFVAEAMADRMAVIADALAVELDHWVMAEDDLINILDTNAVFLDKRHTEIDAVEDRVARFEYLLRELVEAADWRDECRETFMRIKHDAKYWTARNRDGYSYAHLKARIMCHALSEIDETLTEAMLSVDAAIKAAKEAL
jgi:hypothetical protein